MLYCILWLAGRYLLKQRTTWNDLQRLTTNKKRPETTCNDQQRSRNDLKRPTTSKERPETNKKRPGFDLQQARNNSKRPTTSKTQPTMTWTYQEQAKKDAKPQKTSRFSDYFTIVQTVLLSKTFSTQHMVAIIWALFHREAWW